MTPPIESNSRELRLARRALRQAQTHLRQAAARVSMPVRSAERCVEDARDLESFVSAAEMREVEANAHLWEMRQRRRKVSSKNQPKEKP